MCQYTSRSASAQSLLGAIGLSVGPLPFGVEIAPWSFPSFASQTHSGPRTKNAIAEGIINNVRKTIIRDQLTDPRFYEEISKLLEDLIKQRRNETLAYEDFLQKAEALVKRLASKQPTAGLPVALHGKSEAIVLFNNLASIPAKTFQCPVDEGEKAKLALEIDLAMREKAPAHTSSAR